MLVVLVFFILKNGKKYSNKKQLNLINYKKHLILNLIHSNHFWIKRKNFHKTMNIICLFHLMNR